jgi:hypothetical protein
VYDLLFAGLRTHGVTAELIRSAVERAQRLVQQRFCAAIVHVLSKFLDLSPILEGAALSSIYSVLVRRRI